MVTSQWWKDEEAAWALLQLFHSITPRDYSKFPSVFEISETYGTMGFFMNLFQTYTSDFFLVFYLSLCVTKFLNENE